MIKVILMDNEGYVELKLSIGDFKPHQGLKEMSLSPKYCPVAFSLNSFIAIHDLPSKLTVQVCTKNSTITILMHLTNH